ncbi:enoyl-CoA hydratase/isomerase family protein [Actinocrinis puniceicyclus]|uniref:enoyl-CoA hydratase n=1 Tax=Actinocrinis puniceicyclus TaxID=977794 RepID=A0A8J7WMG3_9ACTN|nr:enoyl-CoA hydratase/isomerase family protein [Actinocrinis puniceicyclus]
MAVRQHGHVAELVLDRPAALNAISTALARELAAEASALAANPSIRAIVLSALGDRAFCVGADLKERNGFTDADLLAQRPVFRRAFGSIIDLPVPAIAAVSGFALGGGCELALACDLIVADDGAQFGLPEVGVGLVPGGGGTQLLARRIGVARAADLIYTGRRVTADEATALGIVNRRVTGQHTARDAALKLAAQIAANSPVGVRNAKHALRAGIDLPLSAGLDVEDAAWRATAFSQDRIEGIRAFAEKREPRWPA